MALSALSDLKLARTRNDVAALLRYRASRLSYIVYQIPKRDRYTVFSIPKRSGGERRIDAPIPQLKLLQRRLANLLTECLQEIEAAQERKNTFSHAFRKGSSIITNARAHKNRRYVLNIDLQDFFPTLHLGRVIGFLVKNEDFKLNKGVATLLAQIACNDGKLPQGSPCSPILSELLTHFLDVRLARLAANNRCTYTRYADDITFSTNQKEFPAALAVRAGEGWLVGNELRSRIEDASFRINDAKTRMQLRGSSQSVTGLTVNTKVNVPQRYYKRVRAMTHVFLMTGEYERDGEKRKSVQSLEAMLNHVFHVKERQIDLEIDREKNEGKKKKLIDDRKEVTDKHPSAIRVLYRRLVFYRHFVAPDKPLVVGEGITDNVYLKCAVQALAATYPRLAPVRENDKLTYPVQFFNYTPKVRELLGLRGGSSHIKTFLEHWKSNFVKYSFRPIKHPVIVLIDNDDGANGIFKLLKNRFNVTVEFKTQLPFYHLENHLYLIKTPEQGEKGISSVEDFFPPALLDVKIDGKVFNRDKEHEAPGEYGKVVFAEQVVRRQASPEDFVGFAPILERISAAIEHYYSQRILKFA